MVRAHQPLNGQEKGTTSSLPSKLCHFLLGIDDGVRKRHRVNTTPD